MNVDYAEIIEGLRSGSIVPVLGPGALLGSVDEETGEPIPAEGEALILAMNNGRPMAPKLMYEFSRAAMNIELKRGRKVIERFLTQLYSERNWSRAPLHDWLANIKPPYVIDFNRDNQLQESYQETPHYLIVAIARVGGTEYRFRLYHYAEGKYEEITPEEATEALPILFKPQGTPTPVPSFIASDADYVDYITELMGGFGLPAFLKTYRQEKRYLLLGLRLDRDTERMLLSDIMYGSAKPSGWVFIEEPTDKERKFCQRQGLILVEQSEAALLEAAGCESPVAISA